MKPSDFFIANTSVAPIIIDMVYEWHLKPLERVNNAFYVNVFVSYDTPGQPSCYRPYWWEKARGRNGRSQHTFGEREKIILNNQRGGCDITCDNFKENKDALLQCLIDNTEYIRFAIYDTFIHADYRDLYNGKRRIFTSTKDSKWTFLRYV